MTEIIAIVVITAIFLYWKFGGKVSLSGVSGIAAQIRGAFSSSILTGKGKRFEVSVLLGLILFAVAIFQPWVYSWLGANIGLALFICLLIAVYIMHGPESTWLPVTVLALLTVTGIYGKLPSENNLKQPLFPAKNEVVQAHGGIVNNEFTITTKPGIFTEIKYPSGTKRIELLEIICEEGCQIVKKHAILKGEPTICLDGSYAGQKCAVTKKSKWGNTNEELVEEVFAISSDKHLTISSPKNLREYTSGVSAPLGIDSVTVKVHLITSY